MSVTNDFIFVSKIVFNFTEMYVLDFNMCQYRTIINTDSFVDKSNVLFLSGYQSPSPLKTVCLQGNMTRNVSIILQQQHKDASALLEHQ